MNKTIKLGLSALILLIILSVLSGFFKAVSGNYFANASLITSGLLVIGVAGLIYFAVLGLKEIWKTMAVVALLFTLGSCNYAKSNQQVVVSSDCGMTWSMIRAGEAVPTGTGNRCFMKVVMPNHPMQGKASFITNLDAKVRVVTMIDYDYSITDPLSFIKQAKYLGKANADADSEDALNTSGFETAENSVIDVRIKEVSKDILGKEDIIEMDQSAVEARLYTEINKSLQSFGVQLNFITLTFDNDEQTRQAIDVATAMKIYESKGLGELGKQVMIAKAGATKINVSNEAKPIEGTKED